jgi:2-methylisocitrate lyase-like PEP mutase family enzyme
VWGSAGARTTSAAWGSPFPAAAVGPPRPRYYGPQFTTWYNADKALVFGPPEDCARRAQAYLDAGAQHLILVPTTLDIAQVDRMGREVVPRLRLDRRGPA